MPDNNQKPLSEQLKEVGTNIEQELKRAIQIIEEQVVPEVREKGSTALRDVSQRLSKLAEHLESLNSKPPG
jgi:histidinol dehydrogenase